MVVVPDDIRASLAFVSYIADTISLSMKDTSQNAQSCGAGTLSCIVSPPNSSALTSVSPEGDHGSEGETCYTEGAPPCSGHL